MAFSFSPGQIAPQGSQAITPPGTVAPGTAPAQTVGPPSESPILFIRERGGPISVMASIQIVLIVVATLSVVICGTLYGYSVYLTSQIEAKKAELEARDATFPDYPYDKMVRLSKRMALLNKLLQDYISPRSPLKFLENVVENRVYFDNYTLSRDRLGAYTINFTAITTDYIALIQQLGALKLTEYSKVVPNPKVTGLESIGGNVEIKVQVTTPVLVQGKLPDEIVFLADDSKSTASSTVKSKQPNNATSSSSQTGTTQP